MGSEPFSASARISAAFLALRPPGSRIVAKTVCPLRASVSVNSLPKPVLEPVMRTTCLEFMVIPPCDSTVNQFDAGSKAVGYKKRIQQADCCRQIFWGLWLLKTHKRCETRLAKRSPTLSAENAERVGQRWRPHPHRPRLLRRRTKNRTLKTAATRHPIQKSAPP